MSEQSKCQKCGDIGGDCVITFSNRNDCARRAITYNRGREQGITEERGKLSKLLKLLHRQDDSDNACYIYDYIQDKLLTHGPNDSDV